jgi:tRNA pseudouridine38-40 synthase
MPLPKTPSASVRLPTTSGPDTGAAADGVPRLAKRKVAIFLGYEGTAYRGLQSQPSAPSDTVEDALQAALFAAGGILSTNLGSVSRLAWSRSSRTDKRVHSLSTVVAMKLECDPDGFDADPDGAAIAAAVNAHLPPQIRVFSVQRVNNAWNAREECTRRSYIYHLPASALGLAMDGGEGDRRTLAALAEAWGMFEGSHAFHNYTKRRLYRDGASDGWSRRKKKGGKRAGGEAGGRVEGEESSEEEEVEEEAFEAEEEPHSCSPIAENSSLAGSAHEELGDAALSLTPGGLPLRPVRIEWRAERNAADPVVRRHRRYMESCTVSEDLFRLVPGGRPCVRLSVTGTSFMLHQIRHMVGAATAVATGRLPLQLIQASMAAPTRVALPLAPPSTLVLASADFSPFRPGWDGKPPVAAKWTGDRVALKGAGVETRDAFAREVLLPALDELLESEEWERWGSELDRLTVDPVELAELAVAYEAWGKEMAERRVRRMGEGAAAAEYREET